MLQQPKSNGRERLWHCSVARSDKKHLQQLSSLQGAPRAQLACQLVATATAAACIVVLLQGCGGAPPAGAQVACGLPTRLPPPACRTTPGPQVGVGLSLQYQSSSIGLRKAVAKLASVGVRSVRLWDYKANTLQLLLDHGIKDVFVNIPNTELRALAYPDMFSNPARKISGVVESFDTQGMTFVIGVGNEPTAPWVTHDYGQYLAKGLQNLYDALADHGLSEKVKLTVVFDASIFMNTFPPTQGAFHENVVPEVAQVIHSVGGVFTMNLYPWFSRKDKPEDVPLDLALGEKTNNVDGVKYHGLLHQQIAAMRAALTRLNPDFISMPLIVAESGWPSAGHGDATAENACRYVRNSLLSSSVMDPHLQTLYMFEGFDEDAKRFAGDPGGEEENSFGLFYARGEAKFVDLSFSCEGSSSGTAVNTSFANSSMTI